MIRFESLRVGQEILLDLLTGDKKAEIESIDTDKIWLTDGLYITKSDVENGMVLEITNNPYWQENLNFGILTGTYGELTSEKLQKEVSSFEEGKEEAQKFFDTGKYDFVHVISWTKGQNPKVYNKRVNYANEFTLLK